jgi:branched-chain amino acid transport system substrate-binding protein
MKRNRFTLSAVAALSAASLLLGTAAGAADEKPITIPVIMPLTGGGAFIGTTQQKSMQILEGIVNKDGGIKGRPIKFDFLDDQTSPQVAKQLGSQEQTVSPIVLGSSLSAMCKAISPVYDTAGPVNYCLSPAIYPAKGSYVFTASASTRDLIIATVRFFREKGWKNFAMLASTDASGQDGVDDLNTAMSRPENASMKLVGVERYNASDVSATAQVTKLKAANPQAIIVWAPGTPFATGLRALQDAGLTIPVASTSANMVAKQLEQYSAFMPKEMYFPGVTYAAGIAQNAQVKKQQDIFNGAMKANGIAVDVQTGMTWDAGLIAVAALRKLGPTATGTQIRDFIASQTAFPGILGMYDFSKTPQRGATVDDVVMMRWTAGSGWSTSSSFGGALK